jgi:hypothetical protein
LHIKHLARKNSQIRHRIREDGLARISHTDFAQSSSLCEVAF